MNKIPYKIRTGIGVGLILWSVVAIIATIVWGSYGAPIWALILIPIVAVITLVIGIIFVQERMQMEPQLSLKKPKAKSQE